MLFNSLDFALFLPIVFAAYWMGRNKGPFWQNIVAVVASYVFYAWWDWRFLSLIFFSTLTDYFIGIGLSKSDSQKMRKVLLWTSVVVNISFLGFFKYYNFFIENFVETFAFFGKVINANSLNIILPVGISFYTFQTMSYSIDVYRKKFEPTRDFIAFTAFVSFFPQLVAGPIERASNLLPQFYSTRRFDYAKAIDGLRQVLWGLFKKMVIADNCAEFANMIFNNSSQYSGAMLMLGAIFFTLQVYGDFSGYSDIAIGTSRLFGINLKQNFAFPFFSRDITEFWRRWHISLSTWFRDYLYIPLGGSRVSKVKQIRNLFVIFIVSGFWHGAEWTYVIWGALHAFFSLPLMLMKKNRAHLDIVAQGKLLPSLKEVTQMLVTFGLLSFSLIFFRAENVPHALSIVSSIFSENFFAISGSDFIGTTLHPYMMFLLIGVFMVIEWIGREKQYALEDVGIRWPVLFRYAVYYSLIVTIFWFGGQQQEFIYFQF